MENDPLTEPAAPKLTAKQKRFCEEYARCFNGAKAARAAKVSKKSAARTAWRWLNEPKFDHVQEYAHELVADAAAQREFDHQLLLQRLRSRLTIDTRGYWGKDGQPRNPRELGQERAQHVQGYTYSTFRTFGKDGKVVQEGSNASITLTSDKKAEEMLGRHSGFFSRESNGDQFADYLQAESTLETSLSIINEEESDADDDSAEGSSEEETAGEDPD